MNDWIGVEDLVTSYQDVLQHDLLEHLAEFNTFGFTILTPEKVDSVQLVGKLRNEMLRITEELTGEPHPLDGEVRMGNYVNKSTPPAPAHLGLSQLLTEADCFREAALHPKVLALLRMAMGRSLQISYCGGLVKSMGGSYGANHGLHCDAVYDGFAFPEPLRAPGVYADVVNTNWCLTDYTVENGPLCVVPGSHHYCRQPVIDEGVNYAIPIVAPAGSVVVFHSNLWHGAFEKTSPGLRLTLSIFYSQPHLKTVDDYTGAFSAEILARHGPLLAQMTGNTEEVVGANMKERLTNSAEN